MKKLFTIFIFVSIFLGCCDLICEREKHAATIIERVEAFRNASGRLPDTLTEIGMDDHQDHLSFYTKKAENEFEVWYGLTLGVSKIYNSKTKKWREEG